MRGQLLHLLPLLSLLVPTHAGPVSGSSESHGQKANPRLLGSSFGIPGNQNFDYVVVGGGTAGLTLANRLSENPAWMVAVVEAGGFYELDNGNVSQIPLFAGAGTDKSTANYNPLIDWGFVTVPQEGVDNAKVHYARGKCLGGSSARNYMAYQRGTKESYNLWAEQVGDSSYTWPSFLPYMQKSLDYTPADPFKRARNATGSYKGRGNGPLSVTFSNYAMALGSWVQKGLKEIGIMPIKDFTSGTLLGSAYPLEAIDAKTQTRESSETGFLRPALERGNLIVFQQSLAKSVVFDAEKRATGVVVDTAGKQYTLSAKREVILSAGVFQSPQLLMVSGVGPTETLERFGIPLVKELPGVGQNMWDHVFFGPSYRVNVITGSSLGNPEFAAKAVTDLLTRQSGIMTNPGGDYLAWEKLPASSRASFSNSTIASLAAFPDDWPEVEYLAVNGYNYATVAAAVVAPLSRGTVSIASADTADAPLIDPRWLTHPTDQAVAVEAYRRLRELAATDAMKEVLIGPEYYPGSRVGSTDAELLQEIRAAFQTVFHASCTCKMGKASDPMAVVDSRARVMGVKGLRVVDASAFPLLPPGHPMGTVYALAEKIADDIKRESLEL